MIKYEKIKYFYIMCDVSDYCMLWIEDIFR